MTSEAPFASHHDLIVERRADDQVRQLKALLFQAQADERIGLAEDLFEDGSNVLDGHSEHITLARAYDAGLFLDIF